MTHRLMLLLTLVALAGNLGCANAYDAPNQELDRLSSEYRQAAAEHHAASNDARDLAAAAMLTAFAPLMDEFRGHGTPDEHDPRWLDAVASARRALQRAPQDHLVAWSVLSGEATRRDRELVRTAASLLRETDADNAATWLLQLQIDDGALTYAERLELLERAAASAHYGTGYSELARLLVAAIRAVEPPARLVELMLEDERVPSAEAIAVAFGFGVMMASVPPATPALDACDGSSTNATVPEDRRDACLRLGRLMTQEGDTMLDESIGLRLWERSAATVEEREAARQRRRAAEWRRSAYVEWMHAARLFGVNDPEWPFVERLWMQPVTTEIAAQRMQLSEAGIPLRPPEGFVSRQQQATGD